MAVKIGKPAPDFQADAWVRGAFSPQRVSLSGYRGKWVVLFFYPRDFTFICPTEIAAFGAMQPQFERENAAVIGASTDSFFTHKAWFDSDPRLHVVEYPVLADTSQEVSRAYDVLLDDGAALRGTYIIDPQGVLRYLCVNELDVGRNVQEILRVLQALQTGELCPVGWQPGQATLTSYDEWLATALPRLSRATLVATTARLHTTRFAQGEVVFEEGDLPDKFYIVAEGEVEVVRRRGDGREKVLATLQPGDYFGEIGLLTEARRTASVRAKTPVELLALDWDAFKKVVESSAGTNAEFAAVIRQRLENA